MDAPGAELSIPKLFADYLRASPAVRNELAALHPLLFTDETLQALDLAASQFTALHDELKEVADTVEELNTELDLPNDGAFAKLQLDEERQLRQPDALIELFAANLAALLAEAADGAIPSESGDAQPRQEGR